MDVLNILPCGLRGKIKVINRDIIIEFGKAFLEPIFNTINL